MAILYQRARDERVNWIRSIPFFLMHLMPIFAVFTGIRLFDVFLLIALYYGRMFFITAGYHRYFAHRSYKLGRIAQFLMAFGGATAAQKGVLWWAGHHRHHHWYSDTPQDIHSPLRGFWWSHVGWILCDKYKATPFHQIEDFAKYPELRWLNRYHLLPPALLAAAVFFLWGPSALFIGFFLSTALLWHGTFTINSLSHVFGRRRYVTGDTSRNSWLLALITLGEGWHNNHHHFQSSTRQGFFWWEIDVSYYVVKLLSLLRIAKGIRDVPDRVRQMNRLRDGHFDFGVWQQHWLRANQVVGDARLQAEEYYSAKRQAMEVFMDEAKQRAEDLARVSKGAAKAR